MRSIEFERFAAQAARTVAVMGFLYSAIFVVVVERGSRWAAILSSILLLGGALLSTVVFVALYGRLHLIDPLASLWVTLLGFAAAVGSAMHGAYDLGILVKTPEAFSTDLPNPTDPRGLATFALGAIAILLFSWLMARTADFPETLVRIGYGAGALLLVTYLGRLIILNPKNPVLAGTAALAGFVFSPVWYAWVGSLLQHGATPIPAGSPPPVV
jgi:hypothetical protein